MFGRTTVLIALVLALALPAAAPARQVAVSKKAPTGLKAFLLSYDEPTNLSFTRTPSFGWKVTRQATSYDFQLATSSSFRENSFIWSKVKASALMSFRITASVAPGQPVKTARR